MSQNCLKFWDKFETKLRTDLRPYRDNFETYLTILLLRANWDIFETWVHSVYRAFILEAAFVGYPWPSPRSSCIGPLFWRLLLLDIHGRQEWVIPDPVRDPLVLGLYFGGCFCWRWQATHRRLILQHFDEDVQEPRLICNGCCLGKAHPPELCLCAELLSWDWLPKHLPNRV